MVVDLINKNFWKNKKVFITGNTGFKGAWLTEWLNLMESEVCGFSLPTSDKNILFKSLNHKSNVQQIFGNRHHSYYRFLYLVLTIHLYPLIYNQHYMGDL